MNSGEQRRSRISDCSLLSEQNNKSRPLTTITTNRSSMEGPLLSSSYEQQLLEAIKQQNTSIQQQNAMLERITKQKESKERIEYQQDEDEVMVDGQQKVSIEGLKELAPLERQLLRIE